MMVPRNPRPPGGTFPLAGRPVPRIGYGMGQLTRRAAAKGGPAEAVALLRESLDLGVRHYDTAQFYGAGLANELLRQALGDVRHQVVLSTKVGARPVEGARVPLAAAQRPDELRTEVEANLTALNTDWLDVVNLRRMDFRPGLLAEGDQLVPLEDQLAELIALRDEGKIVGIGLSHVTLEQFLAARASGVVCVQNIYHLLDRTFEPLLSACRDDDVAWVPYFPLGGGGAYAPLPKVIENPVVRAVADELRVTPSQVGLAWQLSHAPNTMLIPGTASTAHLMENTAAGAIVLSPDIMGRLDATSGAEPG